MNYSNETETIETNYTLSNLSSDSKSTVIYKIYSIGVPVMMVVILAAIIINGRCLLAIKWLRGPLTPTLLLSLSLAAADLYTSTLWILSLIFNSYLPRVWNITLKIKCFLSVMEGFRLSGVITIIGHLTALAINHHLGIVRPLRYPGKI